MATNRQARRDFAIDETFHAGMVLTGPEVKSLRLGRASLSDSFARVRGEEVFVEGIHIPPYEMSDSRGYESKRPRKLLLHRRQIEELTRKTAERGLTLVPLRIYFTRGLAKLELGLGRGKREFEKRQVIAEREHRRDIDRALGQRR